jgi:hypothetical protein
MRPTKSVSFTVCGTVLLLAACAERPVAVSPLLETQPRWETASHWQTLAERAADGLVAAAERGGFGSRAFHIRVAGADAPFGRAFGEFLASALTARGAAVSPDAAGAVIVNASALPIARDPRALRAVPGVATAAGVAALGAEFVLDGWPSLPEVAVLGGLTALLDAARMSQPNSEVVVTVAVMDDSRYLYRLSESYYVRPANLRDYESAEPPPAPLASLPPGPAAPVPVRRIAVVGPAEDRP